MNMHNKGIANSQKKHNVRTRVYQDKGKRWERVTKAITEGSRHSSGAYGVAHCMHKTVLLTVLPIIVLQIL